MSEYDFDERDRHPDGYRHCIECSARIDPIEDDEDYCVECLEEIGSEGGDEEEDDRGPDRDEWRHKAAESMRVK